MRIVVERLKEMYNSKTIDDAKVEIAITKYKLTSEEIDYIKEGNKDEL